MRGSCPCPARLRYRKPREGHSAAKSRARGSDRFESCPVSSISVSWKCGSLADTRRTRHCANAELGVGVQLGVGSRASTKSPISAKSFGFSVISGTLCTFAVAAITRSRARRRGFPPRLTTAAASLPHSRATAASTGNGSNVASITPRRCERRARSSSSESTRTPKCSSASEAALIAPSRSPGPSVPMRTEVSRRARTYSA